MCYSIAFLEHRQQKYAERYKELLPPDWSERTSPMDMPTFYFVSGFSHPLLPIIKHDGMFLFEWGLIPFWINDSPVAKDIQNKTLNAVGETVFQKPSFRKCIASQRCLLGVTGFYEWREANKAKYPYFIHTKSNDIFSLGCVYDTWVDKTTGEIRNTFSILTTAANPLMERIHNTKKRMPLILAPQDEQKWLNPTLTPSEIASLIQPYDAEDMTAYTVSKAANNVRNNRNVPEIMERVEYGELVDPETTCTGQVELIG